MDSASLRNNRQPLARWRCHHSMSQDTDRLDVDYVRAQFPAFATPDLQGWSFFENAGGSYACRQTIDLLATYYEQTKLQPYGLYPASARAGDLMDRSYERWAAALAVSPDEIHFGASTSINAYILSQAFAATLQPGDQVIVTNQDHEANTGAIRRAATAAGAGLVEWTVDPAAGTLDPEVLGGLLSRRTALVTFPHASNVVGQENDVQQLTAMAHEAGARVIVDGVAFAPHRIPNLAELNPDVYLFSLYKTYSVHQGLMAVRNGLIDELPNQGHYFNAPMANKRLTPAGPDHAQIAAAAGVLDYIEALAEHHGSAAGPLRTAVNHVNRLWDVHETRLLKPLLSQLRTLPGIRILGPDRVDGHPGMHRCPTVAFVPGDRNPGQVATELADRKIMAGAGHFYARRLVEGLGVDPATGAVRLSFVHYTKDADMAALQEALAAVLS